MKERPIIFNGEMVRAILDGRKTQTRRVVKSNRAWPIEFVGGRGMEDDPTCWGFEDGDGRLWAIKGDEQCSQIPSPYGQSGDRLWVREAFRSRRVDSLPGDVTYRADHPGEKTVPNSYGRPWKPSIHMPRWACRILLEVTAVRVERLQDITEGDAIVEGAPSEDRQGIPYGCGRSAFMALWDRINFKRGHGWGANPWVWVIEFEQVDGEGVA